MKRWPDSGQWSSASSVSGGHIHDSFRLETSEGIFFLQKFNEQVFPEISSINQNLHLLSGVSLDSSKLSMPLPLPSMDGNLFERSDSGELWRLFPWIERAVQDVRNAKSSVGFVAARFGDWAGAVNQLDPSRFLPAIKGFHQLPAIWEAFYVAWDQAGGDRKHRAAETCSRLAEGVEVLDLFNQLTSGLPERIIHGDPKRDNQLMIQDSDAIAILDLDTVMPGYLWMESGDMIRSMAALTAEDDPSLDAAGIDPDKSQEILNSYAESISGWATEEEIESLRYGPLCIILEQSLRFLTDYLLGDQYYHTEYSEHNFVRAQNQLMVWEAYANWVGY